MAADGGTRSPSWARAETIETEEPSTLAAFFAAAARAGAYQAQVDAGEAALSTLTDLASSPEAPNVLRGFIAELDRLVINMSCRIEQRRPEVLRPLRKRLTVLRRRAILLRRRSSEELRPLGTRACSGNSSGGPTSPRQPRQINGHCELLDTVGPRHL